MEAYSVVIQPEAENDLDEAFQYLEEQQTSLGFQFLEAITNLVLILEENPLLFPKVHKEFRRAVVQRFGYNIIFKVVDFQVYILAIIHGSRSPERWKKRK
jgi:plasmid stabilization system protein ParE